MLHRGICWLLWTPHCDTTLACSLQKLILSAGRRTWLRLQQGAEAYLLAVRGHQGEGHFSSLAGFCSTAVPLGLEAGERAAGLVAQSCLRDTTVKPGVNYLLLATLQHLLCCVCPHVPAQALACFTFCLVRLRACLPSCSLAPRHAFLSCLDLVQPLFASPHPSLS